MEEFNFDIEKFVKGKSNRVIDLVLDENIKDYRTLSFKISMNLASIESIKPSDNVRFDTENKVYTSILDIIKSYNPKDKDSLAESISCLCTITERKSDVPKIISRITELSERSERKKECEEITADQLLQLINSKLSQMNRLNEEVRSLIQIFKSR